MCLRAMGLGALGLVTRYIIVLSPAGPDGQVLQTVKGGTATCVARDANYSCPSGQFVTSSNNGIPTCSAPPSSPIIFGGIFSKESFVAAGGFFPVPRFIQTDKCSSANYFTSDCSCPFWAPEVVSFANVPTNTGSGGIGSGYNIYYCHNGRW